MLHVVKGVHLIEGLEYLQNSAVIYIAYVYFKGTGIAQNQSRDKLIVESNSIWVTCQL